MIVFIHTHSIRLILLFILNNLHFKLAEKNYIQNNEIKGLHLNYEHLLWAELLTSLFCSTRK